MSRRSRDRILMLLENYTYPEDGRVRQEATTLTKAGYRVTVICPSRRGQPPSEIVDGVRVYRYAMPAERTGLLWYLFEYGYAMVATFVITLYVFVRCGFDVVHAHSPPDTFVLIAAPYRLLGRRFVFDHHDLSPEMYDARFGGSARPAVRAILERFERLSLRTADHVVTTNESYRSVALTRGEVPEEAVTIVRNGPDLDRVKPSPPDPELRAKAGIIIGYAGVIAPQDGVDYLIRALARVAADRGPDSFYCVAAGDGAAWAAVRELATVMGLSGRIEMPGRLDADDLMRVLSTADICVDPAPSNPYNDRSTAIKLAEYMALGKPVVAFDLPEHRATAGDAALYARPNEEQDFAACVTTLMDDGAMRARLGAAGRKRVEERLAWRHQGAVLVDVYGDLVGPASTPRPAKQAKPR